VCVLWVSRHNTTAKTTSEIPTSSGKKNQQKAAS